MMLSEQATHVRRKIKVLTESLEAMESLNAEITQIEVVNFKKYADILLNLQMKNDSYQMIKHLDDNTMDMFRERIGHEKTALMAATLNDLYKQAVELIEEAVPPESEKGQTFANTFWETLMELSDGDSNMMLKITEQFEKASSLVNESGEERDAVRDYIKQAFRTYHAHTNMGSYIGSEKSNTLMKFAGLTSEAYQLHMEGVTPESERAQNFAKEFWKTLLEFTDGNMDLISKMNEQATKTANQDEKMAMSYRFIESAVEIYFENGGMQHGQY